MNNISYAKIGVFGGSFDPPHVSHIEMARAIMEERGYEKLVFLPSHNPPHKKLATAGEHRLNMLRLVTQGEFEICTLDMDDVSVGYAVDYLPKLKALYGDSIEYIIGGDSIEHFDKWLSPLEILKMVKMLVVCRDGQDVAANAAISRYDNCDKLGLGLAEYKPASMSSSDIRSRLRLGYDVDDMVDERILAYIKDNNLYNEYSSIKDRLRADLSPKRYNHSMSTALFAVSNMSSSRLSYNKVIVSAMLHDCAKELLEADQMLAYGWEHIPELMSDYNPNMPVVHAFTGAALAMRDYNITDIDILSAICYHTTAKAEMSELDKLIYVSDKLEYTRDFRGVENLRTIYYNNHEDGFIACMAYSCQHLLDLGVEIHSLSEAAIKYYVEDKKHGFQ